MYAGTPAAMRAFFLILQKQFPVEHSVKPPQDASVRAEVAHFIIPGLPGSGTGRRNQDYAVYQKRRYHPVQW